MSAFPYCMAAVTSVLAGLDRTAVLQLMVSRPIVAAPLTGWLLGDGTTGLQIGALLELLWLGRIPVGASIPPDDTQVAIGSTCLAITQYPGGGIPAPAFAVLCLLVTLPFGRIGAYFDRLARRLNGTLWVRAERMLARENYGRLAWLHLQGVLHFGCASLLTFGVILAGGWVSLNILTPLLAGDLGSMLPWLRLGVPLIGISACLSTVNFRRAGWLYGASFLLAYALLWGLG